MVQRAEMEAAVPSAAERVRDLRSEIADPQFVEKAKGRRFSASYKLKMLGEVDRNPGQSGAVLRREGLYGSHLSAWRRQREQGALNALRKMGGPKGKSAEQGQLEKLQRVKARLERELFEAHAIIDAPNKLAEILGVDLPKITYPDASEFC